MTHLPEKSEGHIFATATGVLAMMPEGDCFLLDVSIWEVREELSMAVEGDADAPSV